MNLYHRCTYKISFKIQIFPRLKCSLQKLFKKPKNKKKTKTNKQTNKLSHVNVPLSQTLCFISFAHNSK